MKTQHHSNIESTQPALVVAGAPGQADLAGVGPAEGLAPAIVSNYHGGEPQPILEQLDHQLATKRLGGSAAGVHPSPPPNNASSAQRTWCSEPAVSALVLYIAMPLKWGSKKALKRIGWLGALVWPRQPLSRAADELLNREAPRGTRGHLQRDTSAYLNHGNRLRRGGSYIWNSLGRAVAVAARQGSSQSSPPPTCWASSRAISRRGWAQRGRLFGSPMPPRKAAAAPCPMVQHQEYPLRHFKSPVDLRSPADRSCAAAMRTHDKNH